jgi:alpha-D-ribose 1-methylphosphonate 5-triphosphate synthase subunit PhnH
MNDCAQPMSALNVWHPATQQQTFRRLLDCFAYPGRVAADVNTDREALLALLATLLDAEVDLADPHRLVAASDWPKLEARPGMADAAAFVVADGARVPDFTPRLGTLESPERGATLILTISAVGEGPRLRLSGPGVPECAELALTGLHPGWVSARSEWVASFPLGIDLILCDGTRFAALPRTTIIQLPQIESEIR